MELDYSMTEYYKELQYSTFHAQKFTLSYYNIFDTAQELDS